MWRLLLPLLCLACAPDERPIPTPPTPAEQLKSKWELYSDLSPGGAHETDCDGLLFRSLLEAGRGRSYNVEAWRDNTGKWQRNPTWACERATSHDMIRGLLVYLWSQKRLDLLEDTWHYDGLFVMDDRDWRISTLLPDTISTLALTIHKLGGHDHWQRSLASPCIKGLTGFKAHLQAVNMLHRLSLGVADDKSYECIVDMTTRQPNNAFYWAIRGRYEGDQTTATSLLLNESYWPADSLPTSVERCDAWITQRDEGKDWEPCPQEGKTHSGGDFLIAAAIVLGLL